MPDSEARARNSDHERDRQLLVEAAQAAGGIALGWWRRDPKVWHKNPVDKSSPVSEADFAVDHFLMERLRAARPDYGWLSEETEDDPDRLTRERVLIVDPIDGTRAFLAGSTEWTISLAVVENGLPVAAALYRPAKDMMFSAALGHGACLDAEVIAIGSEAPGAALKVAGPTLFMRELPGFGYEATEHAYVPSLALRIALAANRRYDLVFARAGASDWDIAAADLILREAGGVLRDPSGLAPVYNRAHPRHGALAGGSESLVSTILPIISAHTHAAARNAS